MGDLVKTDNRQVATRTIDPFAEYANTVAPKNIIGTLLRFKKGDWVAGLDQTDVPEGTRFIAIMDKMAVGWVRWQDKKPTDQNMSLVISGGAPRRAECGEMDREAWPEVDDKGKPKDPWQQTNYIPMLNAKTGEAFTFATSTITGIKSAGRFAGAYAKGRIDKPDQYPVIEIKTSYYISDDYGKVEYPDFPIVGWVSNKKKYEAKLEAGDYVEKKEEPDLYKGVRSEDPGKGFDDEIPF